MDHEPGLYGARVRPPRRRDGALAMQTASSRVVTLVLCRRDGAVLGALAPFEVDVPWWQEVGPVVVAARQAHDVDIVILRLLAGEPGRMCLGGPVTYLAEVGDEVDVAVRPVGSLGGTQTSRSAPRGRVPVVPPRTWRGRTPHSS